VWCSDVFQELFNFAWWATKLTIALVAATRARGYTDSRFFYRKRVGVGCGESKVQVRLHHNVPKKEGKKE